MTHPPSNTMTATPKRELQITYLDPSLLTANPWNTNMLGREEEDKLDASLRRFDLFDAIKVRTLANGTLEVLGGKHRAESARRLKYETVPVMNLGEVDDVTAREISMVDNGRYGRDDPLKLAALMQELKEAEVDVSEYLVLDKAAMDAALACESVDFDSIGDPTAGLENENTGGPGDDDEPVLRGPVKTTLKYQLEPALAEAVSRKISDTINEKGIAEGSARANAGTALAYLLLGEDAL